MKYTKESIIERFNAHEEMNILAFPGNVSDLKAIPTAFLSPWYDSPFDLYDHHYRSAVQYIMAQKAALFTDRETWRRIMKAESPDAWLIPEIEIKKFDPGLWDQEKYQIILTANLAKFSQYPELLDLLLKTGDSVLVEGDPGDNILGVNLGFDDPKIMDPNKWQGENLFGFALMEARDILREWDAFGWDDIEWNCFNDDYHKDGDDPDITEYDSTGFILKAGKYGLIRSDGSDIGRKELIAFYPQWNDCEEMGTGYTSDDPVEAVSYYMDYYFTRPAGGYIRSRLKNTYYFVRVLSGGKYGVVDSAGRVITPCKWDEIDRFGNARQGDLWGFVNLLTCEETEPTWAENRHLDPYKHIWSADEITNWAFMFGPGSANRSLQWRSTMIIFYREPETGE